MRDLIAVCGLDCEKCEARIATVNNDDELRKKVAIKWSNLNEVEITPEMINCMGCKADGVKTPFCESMCPIRLCATEKRYATCKECSKKVDCKELSMIISTNKEAFEKIIKD